MAAIQLNFSLRTSSSCKTVHLLGSWDGYKNQLPLSKDATTTKAGGWKGTFRFQGTTLKQGARYWYYYIIDGYHVSHDPARESITEPTTGRKLNVLDIPKSPAAARGVAPASAKQVKPTQSGHQRRVSSANVAKGRSLSPSQIKSPQPTKPHETRVIATERFDNRDVERLTTRLRNTPLSDSESDISESESDSGSDLSSDVPSLSSRSSNSSSPSSISSTGSCCSCERYGITRSGNRVKLDCGGRLCGFSDHSSTCSSESESEDKRRVKTTRRQGLVVRR